MKREEFWGDEIKVHKEHEYASNVQEKYTDRDSVQIKEAEEEEHQKNISIDPLQKFQDDNNDNSMVKTDSETIPMLSYYLKKLKPFKYFEKILKKVFL